MSRLFISHSSKDSVAATAFKQWLGANGWPDEDVFLDVDSIDAGERWKEALRNANTRCEAVILLASPDALSSPECLAEVRKAEDFGKEIVVILLRDLEVNDRRLDSYKDRQIVDLAAPPQSYVENVSYRGERHEIRFNGGALARVKAFLAKRGITPDRFAWPARDKPDAEPFPGLSAFTEDDAGIFFGRDADIVRGLDKLRVLRRNGSPRFLVILAASGAGKSSYLRAGLWPRLGRDFDFATLAILRPAQGILTGPEGLGRKLAARLSRPDQPVSPGEIHAQLMAPDMAAAARHFSGLMATVAAQASAQRRIGEPGARAPALVLAIDQAEELFGSDDAAESQRFLSMLGSLMHEQPPGVEPLCLFTIRADGAGRLLQTVADLNLEVPETLPLLALPATSYRDVILKPLEVLARRGQRLTLAPALADRLVTDATGADALPLLAFTISHLYREFSATGSLTLEQYEGIGGIAGSIDMALKQALAKPGDTPAIPAARDEQLAQLRAAFIPWLARVDPETGGPMRRVARLDEIPQSSHAIMARLVEARLLVADRRSGADVVEIAHESLLRQWPALTEWLRADAENLALVDAIERAASGWVHHDRQEAWLDHRGGRLRAAERLAARQDFRKRLGDDGIAYIKAARKKESADRQRKTLVQALVGGLAVALCAGFAAWKYPGPLRDELYRLRSVSSLTTEQERALKTHDVFKECTHCPEMVVIPAGSITMGSLLRPDEQPPHRITMARPFAVAKFETTFGEWDGCVAYGDCAADISDQGWGRGTQPVINVSWKQAQQYVAWLGRVTGKDYELLTEAQWEYAARAGSSAYFSFRDNDDKDLDNHAWYAGNSADAADVERHAHRVGQKLPNKFGLYDMHGNVSEWVEDCYHGNYQDAPTDGSAWTSDNCLRHVIRGGSFLLNSRQLRSASRDWHIDKGTYVHRLQGRSPASCDASLSLQRAGWAMRSRA